MSRKIKLHTFNALFQLFAYLADRTGGWRVFVRPKLLLGSLIVGLGLTGCGTKSANKPKETVHPSKNQKTTNKSIDNKNKISVADSSIPDISCYVIDVTYAYKRNQEPIWDVPEQMPQFPGGADELMATLKKSINYSAIAKEDNIEGKVILGCVITKTGEISDIVVLRSLDPACDKEAIRIVKLLPRWIPGKQDGKNVNVRYTLPVIFKLPKQ
jgi:periplasmic protein TonB